MYFHFTVVISLYKHLFLQSVGQAINIKGHSYNHILNHMTKQANNIRPQLIDNICMLQLSTKQLSIQFCIDHCYMYCCWKVQTTCDMYTPRRLTSQHQQKSLCVVTTNTLCYTGQSICREFFLFERSYTKSIEGKLSMKPLVSCRNS